MIFSASEGDSSWRLRLFPRVRWKYKRTEAAVDQRDRNIQPFMGLGVSVLGKTETFIHSWV